jgi:alpha-galactosidase
MRHIVKFGDATTQPNENKEARSLGNGARGMRGLPRLAIAFTGIMFASGHGTAAEAVRPEEMQQRDHWIEQGFLGPKPQLPFSFAYGGQASAELLTAWPKTMETRKLDDARTQHTLTWTDPKTGLELQCVAIEYRDFPAVEWVLYAKNMGDKDTPILEELYALDARLTRADPGEFIVHHLRGSNSSFSDFSPITDTIPATGDLVVQSHGEPTSMGSPSGSPSVEAMPMFNVEYGQQGVIAALGWSGPWSATFQRDGDRAARVRAKMEATHLFLHPGERIRSPRVLMLFWKGDRVNAHNVWRRLILAHYSPRPGGKPFAGLTADANWSNIMDADHHIQQLNWWGDHDIPMECYWMDAAWTDMSKGWFAHQSQQTPDKTLFPDGMRPISDAAHKRGMKYLLWFVPHGLHPEVGIGKDHPEFLGAPFTNEAYPGQKFYALDHGNPEINRFMIAYFSKIVSDFGVDIFRQDGTAGWPADTGPDRLGISQIRYTEGFYAFWDGLLERNPNLMIDNCATGARRVELETMKRSIVLWRSDSQATSRFDPLTNQAFNQGLFPWAPLHAGAVPLATLSPYSFRSAYCPVLVVGWPDEGMPPPTWITDVAKRWSTIDMDLLRRLMKEYLKVRPYTLGDYYALTPHSLDTKVWAGWQFDRPDLGEGMVQMFRRQDSVDESLHVEPRGLEPHATYTLTNLDAGGTASMTGRRLMDDGLAITIKERPGSALITYQKRP